MTRKKYSTLTIGLKKKKGGGNEGIFINDDCYITARREGGAIQLVILSPKENYRVQRDAVNYEAHDIPDDLIEQVKINERAYIARNKRDYKKSTVLKKKPRLIHNKGPR